MPYIDLSHRISADTQTHLYDSPFRLYHEKHLETDKFNGFRMETGMHVGTHIDFPFHLTARRSMACDAPLSRFTGPGVVIDARGVPSISADCLRGVRIPPQAIVLLHTGMSALWGTPDYFTGHPVVQEAFINTLLAQDIRMLGIDAYAPDRYPFPIHQLCFAQDVPILENLTSLQELPQAEPFTVYAFPLNIEAEGSPVRAVAHIP